MFKNGTGAEKGDSDCLEGVEWKKKGKHQKEVWQGTTGLD